MENIQQIVHKSKILANRLKLAISHQNDLTQGNFDVTGLEFSKSREVLDKNLTSAEKKYNAIQDEILGVKGRVDEISEEYSVISEENSSLAKLENALLNRVKPLNAERYETAQELQ